MGDTSSGQTKKGLKTFLKNVSERLRGDAYNKTLRDDTTPTSSEQPASENLLSGASRRTSGGKDDEMNYKCDACGSCLTVGEVERARNAHDEKDRKCPVCGGPVSGIQKLPSGKDILQESRQEETV